MGHIYYGPMQLSCYLVAASRGTPLYREHSEGYTVRSTDSAKMRLLIWLLTTFVTVHAGLLRVPKVYNAVITSNQNLSPSRAFPVIQPVVHRTAFGYVPPFYYTQVAPHFTGPGVVHVPQPDRRIEKNSRDTPIGSEPQESSSTIADSKRYETAMQKHVDPTASEKSTSRKKTDEQEQLSFYPNYHSLYYEPYIYTYNGYNAHLVPGTYYVDYPYGAVNPIPPSAPRNNAAQLLSGYHENKKQDTDSSKRTIPDVPPPPLPTTAPKSS